MLPCSSGNCSKQAIPVHSFAKCTAINCRVALGSFGFCQGIVWSDLRMNVLGCSLLITAAALTVPTVMSLLIDRHRSFYIVFINLSYSSYTATSSVRSMLMYFLLCIILSHLNCPDQENSLLF